VFPDVERVRAWHQTSRYEEPPTIVDEDDGWAYPMKAYCKVCKGVRFAWVLGVRHYRKGVWREVDGTRAILRGTEEIRACAREWASREGHEWRKGWARREAWGAWRKSHLKARKAEWMREDELARMQLDTVITGMADDESANLGWYEDGVLGDGY